LQSALELAQETQYSSLHIQFPHPDELALLEQAGFKLRKDCQFHWHNRDYASFDEFLQQFSSAKRKKVRRDRRRVAEQGIKFRWRNGDEISRSLWQDVFDLISITFRRRGSLPYFSLDFFLQISQQLPRNIGVAIAERQGQPIAAAVFYISHDSLYGRYWGSDGQYDALHFETCYYQGIEYCIANRLQHFEPGTQGEHKISRGFSPVTTWSAHWLKQADFFAAVGRYLKEEQSHIEDYVDAVHDHSPYRKTVSDPEGDPT
jgi:predicted N-acyltransferase